MKAWGQIVGGAILGLSLSHVALGDDLREDKKSLRERAEHMEAITLSDQYDVEYQLILPNPWNHIFLIAAKGSESVAKNWRQALSALPESQFVVKGVASLRDVPTIFRRLARSYVLNATTESVLLDWNGDFPAPPAGRLLVRVVGRCGIVEDIIVDEEVEEQVAKVLAKIQWIGNQSGSCARHSESAEVVSTSF